MIDVFRKQLQNLSAEVSTVRRALLRAKEESGTHPLAPTPEESLVQILQESDWPNALTYAKQNKYVGVRYPEIAAAAAIAA